MKTKALITMALFLASAQLYANDWTNWRGPERNGVSRETNLPSDLEDVMWMKKDVSCRSTPIVMNDKVYIVSKHGDGADEQERVLCMDARTGEVIWEHRFEIFYTPIVSIRLGWTVPAGDAETGNIYAHGTQGLLFCFDGATGKIVVFFHSHEVFRPFAEGNSHWDVPMHNLSRRDR